jgi:hypothetical protein
MLGDRHQLHMGKALGSNVFRQLVGELTVAQPGPPGHQVHLVGAHRLEHRVLPRTLGHPLGVAPGVGTLRDLGRGLRRYLGGERQRIRAVAHGVVGAVYPELVQSTDLKPGPEQLPDTRGPEHAQLRLVAVPVVELADQADALGIRRPHREGNPFDCAVGGGEAARMRPQDLP